MSQYVYDLAPNSASVNQGVAPGSEIDWRRIKGMIAAPIGYYLTPAQLLDPAALQAKLQADAINADLTKRIYIIGGIENTEAQNSTPVVQNRGYGQKSTLYGAEYGATYTFAAGLRAQENRQKFNDRYRDFLFFLYDEYNQIFGTAGVDTSGQTPLNVIQGFTVHQWYANNLGMDPGQGSDQTVSVDFADSGEFNRGNLRMGKMNFNPTTKVKQIADVALHTLSPLATQVVTIAPIAANFRGNEGTNMARAFPTIFGGATGLQVWQARDHATGTALTITSAVKSVVNGQDGITLTFGSTGYPSAGGSIDIYWVDPATLGGLGPKYYEANIINLAV